jgi:hypothetical protein
MRTVGDGLTLKSEYRCNIASIEIPMSKIGLKCRN